MKRQIIIGVVLIILVLCGGIVLYKFNHKMATNVSKNDEIIKDVIEPSQSSDEQKNIKTVDLSSNSRNVGVMINNLKAVWGYQSGLQDSYLAYEIITEGGITRFFALFRDVDTERIGTVRSARIYFLDYAMENDALYVHIGGSQEATNDLKTLGLNHLQSEVTWRDTSLGLAREHTAFTSMKNIMEKAKNRGIRTTKNKDLLLKYSTEEIDLSKFKDSKVANSVFINYSGYKNTSYKYNSETKLYERYQNDKPHTDYVTKKQYTVKNIITYQVKNTSYDSYGRQELANIGTGTGYYISNGYAVPITWEKKTRDSQTKYKYMDGREIEVNDGNTFIHIQPLNKELRID